MKISKEDVDMAAFQHAADLIRAASDSLQQLNDSLRSHSKLDRDVESCLESIEEAQGSVKGLSKQLASYLPGDEH